MSDQTEVSAERWEIPSIDGAAGAAFPTADELQELQQTAWDEAFEEGKKAGLEAGEAEVKSCITQLESLIHALSAPFEELDDELEQAVVDLSMTVARQLFRRELKIDPSHIIGVVRDALKLLPVASRDIKVHLHPDDAALVQSQLSRVDGERAWSIAEDPLVSRGGCRVSTDQSHIDAQAETRINNLINSIVGNERQNDSND